MPAFHEVKSAHLADHVIVADEEMLPKFFSRKRTKLTLENYGGTYLRRSNVNFLFLEPLSHIHTLPYGKFVFSRWLDKIFKPEKFVSQPFSWKTGSYEDVATLLKASILVVDIETLPTPEITCVGFTPITDGKIGQTIVFGVTEPTWYVAVKDLLASETPKCFHNGKYDLAYLLRYRFKTVNWLYDTMHLMHAQYSELPKDLSFAHSLYALEHQYWKDEAATATNKTDALAYNAKDCHGTAELLIGIIKQLPDYAFHNYMAQMRLQIALQPATMQGLWVDESKRAPLVAEQTEILDRELASLRACLGNPNFNPSSPKQVAIYSELLAPGALKATDSKAIAEMDAQKYPLASFILRKNVAYKKAAKLMGTYLNTPLMEGKLLYSFNAAGTETGRLSSKASDFWVGTQIQNLPPYAKKMLRSTEGWLLFEADYSQAESRGTAYMSDCLPLIDAVENSPDFHCHNASLFFGIPFEELWKDGKVLRPEIRKIAKAVNHGANYNMGENVLISTMGAENVWKAGKVLGLEAKSLAFAELRREKLLALLGSKAPTVEQLFSSQYTLVAIASHLLNAFSKAYPDIKGKWYQETIHSIVTTRKLVSPLGWTRWFFGSPEKHKPDLNAAVAHGPQNLNSHVLSKAYYAAWLELADPKDFTFLANIHDSVLGEYKPEAAWKLDRLKSIMEKPVTGFKSGKSMVVPVDLKFGKTHWGDLK